MWLLVIPVIIFSFTSIFNKSNKWIPWLIFFPFSYLFCLRGEIGTDWKMYKYYYENSFHNEIRIKASFEAGYQFITDIFYNLGLSYWAMVFFISFLAIVIFAIALNKSTKNIGVALLLSLPYYFYPGIEALRQILALSLFFLSLTYIKSNKSKTFFLINAVGFLFHRTSLLAFVYYYYQKSSKNKIIFLLIILLFPIMSSVYSDLFSLFPYLFIKYQAYIEQHGGSMNYSVFTSAKILEYILMYILIKYNSLKELNENIQKKDKTIISLLEFGILLQTMVFTFITIAAYRLVYYCDYGLILGYCRFYDCIKTKYNKLICLAIYILIVSLKFYRIIINAPHLYSW